MKPSRFVLLVVLASASLVAFGAPSASAGMKFANMTGAQEVPGPGDADGTGVAMINLRVGAGQVCVSQRHNNIAAPNLMHIHSGAAGVMGPIVVNLTPVINGGCVNSTTPQVRAIDRNPADFYMNLHNGPFPNGAIRGQLDASLVSSAMPATFGPTHLFGRMSGAQETPDPGDPNGRGSVFIDVKPGLGQACVDERYAGIEPATLMHIHSGAAGVPGPIVVNLTTALNGGARCVNADPVVLRQVRNNPAAFYCNIHNGPFPNGAIRGQLEPSS